MCNDNWNHYGKLYWILAINLSKSDFCCKWCFYLDVFLKSYASFYNGFLQEWVWISSQASICRFPQGSRLRSERSTLKKVLLEKIKVLYWPNCTEISLYYILFMNPWVFRETQSKVILWKIEWNSDVSPEPSFAGSSCVTLENLIHLFGLGFSHL